MLQGVTSITSERIEDAVAYGQPRTFLAGKERISKKTTVTSLSDPTEDFCSRLRNDRKRWKIYNNGGATHVRYVLAEQKAKVEWRLN